MSVRMVASWAGAVLVGVGVVWLGPLMLDQFVLFADQGQTADAEAARAVMPLPALVLVAGAALLAAAGLLPHAAVGALPLLAVALALSAPDTMFQLLAYGVLGPAAIGAALAAVIPLRGRLGSPWVLVAVAIVGMAAIMATPFVGGVVALGAVAWWGLSRWPRTRTRTAVH